MQQEVAKRNSELSYIIGDGGSQSLNQRLQISSQSNLNKVKTAKKTCSSSLAQILKTTRAGSVGRHGKRTSVLISSAFKCLILFGTTHDQLIAFVSFFMLLLCINQASVNCQEAHVPIPILTITGNTTSSDLASLEVIAARVKSSNSTGATTTNIQTTNSSPMASSSESSMLEIQAKKASFPLGLEIKSSAAGSEGTFEVMEPVSYLPLEQRPVLPIASGANYTFEDSNANSSLLLPLALWSLTRKLAGSPLGISESHLENAYHYYPRSQPLNSSAGSRKIVPFDERKTQPAEPVQQQLHANSNRQQHPNNSHNQLLHRQRKQVHHEPQSFQHHTGRIPLVQMRVPSPKAWRQARLHAHEIQPIHSRHPRLFRRVLLCDKTLVSLDFSRGGEGPNQHHYHNPHHHAHNNHHHNRHRHNNRQYHYQVELESASSNADPTYHDSPELELEFPETSANSIELENLDHLDGDQLLRRVSNMTTTARSSILGDEHSLVRCDMWDLDKGLKSRKPPLNVLRLAIKADFATVREAINRCRKLSEAKLPADDGYRDELDIITAEDMFSLFNMKRGLIPGTKWCGIGDIASSYNDLGAKHRIDICCRAHDHCPTRLKPFRNDYGVLNIALYTKSHCDCDADFYRCLRNLHSKTADMLGNLYFNVMKLQCLREEKVKVCKKVRPIALGLGRCVRYDVDHRRTTFKFTTPPVAY